MLSWDELVNKYGTEKKEQSTYGPSKDDVIYQQYLASKAATPVKNVAEKQSGMVGPAGGLMTERKIELPVTPIAAKRQTAVPLPTFTDTAARNAYRDNLKKQSAAYEQDIAKYTTGWRANAVTTDPVFQETNKKLSDARKQLEQISKLEQAENYGQKYLDKEYKDNFWGQAGANYATGRMGQDSSMAWNAYLDNPTEANRKYAESIDAALEKFRLANAETLDDEGAVLPWLSQSFANYVPQFVDQTKATVAGAAGGAIAGGTVVPVVGALGGARAGAVMGTGMQSHAVMRGAAFKALIDAGIDEETALRAANDEALISSLIEMGDTAIDMATLGSLSAFKSGISGAFKAAAGESAKKKALLALGNYGINIGSEGLEEALQEAVSIGNARRIAEGDMSLNGLIDSSIGVAKDAITGKDLEARGQILEAAGEGAKIAAVMGGADAAVTKTGEAFRKYLDAKYSKPETSENASDTQNALDTTPTTEPQTAPQSDVALEATNTTPEVQKTAAVAQAQPNAIQNKIRENEDGYIDQYYHENGANILKTEAERRGSLEEAEGIYRPYYTAGLTGQPLESVKGAMTVNADQKVAEAMWRAGISDRQADVTARLKGQGKISRGEVGVNLMTEAITESQKALANLVAKVGKMKVTIVDTLGENGELGDNGIYKKGTNEVVIALDAETFSGTLFHETVHYIKQANAEGYERMAKAVFSIAAEIEGLSVEQYIKKYESSGMYGKAIESGEYDFLDIQEEMVADAFQMLAADEARCKSLIAELKQNDPTVLEQIKEFISKLLETLEGLVKDGRFHAFAEDINKDIENTKKLQKIFAAELREAGENAKANVEVDGTLTTEDLQVAASTMHPENGVVKMSRRLWEEKAPKQEVKVNPSGKVTTKMSEAKSGRDVLIGAYKKNGFKKKEIDEKISFIDEVAEFMDKAALDLHFVNLTDINEAKLVISPRDGSIVLSAMVKNGDYAVNFDLTKICAKRVAMSNFIDTLAKRKGRSGKDTMLEEISLTSSNIYKMNEILRDAGYETACLGCFVESRRYNIETWATEFIDIWNGAVDKYGDGGYFGFSNQDVFVNDLTHDEVEKLNDDLETYAKTKDNKKLTNKKKKIEDLVKNVPAMRKKLKMADLITADGRTNLHKKFPELESLVLQHYGSNTPKSVEVFTPYNNEIALMSNKVGDRSLAEYLHSIAGVRSQSFSDFIITHVFDVLQKTADMEAQRLPGHVYTKVPARVRLFGMTGEKHNMSVMFNIDPDVSWESAGLREDGSYFVGDQATSDREAALGRERTFVQSFPWDEAVAIQNDPRYSANCGIIGVSYSYNANMKMLDDPEIPYIIGYHASGMPTEIKAATHITLAADYTSVQNTLAFNGFTKVASKSKSVPTYATWATGMKKATSKGVEDTFDIKATYDKKGAKATLKELFDIAERKGYALETTTAKIGSTKQNGHGDFDIYGDLAKTKNPKKTADNYIDWCMEKGFLPAFYEFALHENYYKFLFDFRVYDGVTGKYAPQNAVTTTFPDNFLDMLDGYLKEEEAYNARQAKKFEPTLDKIYEGLKIGEGFYGDAVKRSARERDAEYMAAVENGDMEKAQRMVNEKAREAVESGAVFVLPGDEDVTAYQYHRGPIPKKTRIVYKAFNVDELGQVTATYAGVDNPMPFGMWLDAVAQRYVVGADGNKYIPGLTGTASALAGLRSPSFYGFEGYTSWLSYRPAFHASSVPAPLQMRVSDPNAVVKKGQKKPVTFMPHNKLIFKVEVSADIDYQSQAIKEGKEETERRRKFWRENPEYRAAKKEEAKKNAIAKAKKEKKEFDPVAWEEAYDAKGDKVISNARAQMSDIPEMGLYTYKNNGEEWVLAGSFRILGVMSEAEIRKINEEHGIKNEGKDKMDWLGGYHPEEFGLTPLGEGETPAVGDSRFQNMKLADAVTYDDNGNVIPLSERFNPEKKDIRYSVRERDEAYMAAVNSNDMAKAQAMVDAAAEETGYTIKGNHGTLKYFTIFDRTYGNAEGDWGKGFYFTTNEDDADANYASADGADLQHKIEMYAENLKYRDEYEDEDEYSDEDLYEIAREELASGEPRIIEAYLKMKNPVVVGGADETFFDVDYNYDEETDEYGEPSGLLVEFCETVKEIIEEGDYIYSEGGSGRYDGGINIYRLLEDGEGLTASQLYNELDDALPYILDEDGMQAANEIAREAFERMGFDGIADRTVARKFGSLSGRRNPMAGVDEDTTHYIVFKSNQIKQADPVTYDDNGRVIPLSQRFNMDNKDIRWSVRESGEAELQKLRTENEHLQKLNENLKKQFKLTDGTTPDAKSVRRVAKEWLKQIQSKADLDDFSMKLGKVAEYFAKAKSDYEQEQAMAALRSLTREAMEESEVLNTEMRDSYSDLIGRVKKATLKVGEELRSELEHYGGYNSIRRDNFGRMNLSSKNGRSIDSFYMELCDDYPEFFKEEDAADEAEQLMNIIAVLDTLRPEVENPYGYYIDEYVDDEAAGLLEKIAEIKMEQTFADKKKADKKAAMDKLRSEFKAERKRMREEAKAAQDEAIRKAENKTLAEQMYAGRKAAEAQAKYQRLKERNKQNADKRKRSAYRKSAEKALKELLNWMRKPTEKNHVQEAYLPLIQVLTKIDTERQDIEIKQADVVNICSKLEKLEKEGYASDLTDAVRNIANNFEDYFEDGMNLNDMNTEQMKVLRDFIKGIKRIIVDNNKAKAMEQIERISDLGDGVIDKADKSKNVKATGRVRALVDFFGLELLTPNVFFKGITDSVHENLYKGLRSSHERKAAMVDEAMKFINEESRLKDRAKWEREKVREFTVSNGQKAYLTVPQIMSLYCHMKREQSKVHIVGGEIKQINGKTKVVQAGGIQIEPYDGRWTGLKNRKAAEAAMKQTERIMVTEEDVKTITDTLTEQQKKLADAIQKFFSTVAAGWGNATSMLMWGYKNFLEPNYFPIESSEDFMVREYGVNAEGRPVKQLKNLGFTHNTVTGANNPIIIRDIFSVFATHIDQMASYAAFVPILSDMQKFMNYKQYEQVGVTEDGKPVWKLKTSVSNALKVFMGLKAEGYINDLMRQINMAAGRDDTSSFPVQMTRRMKIAAVGANLRVMAQQPTSIVRAAAVINPVYLLNPANTALPADYRTMYKYAPIALLKKWGGADMDTGRTMKQMLTGGNWYDKTVDISMWGAGALDARTWGRIWKACVQEIKAKNRELEGEELYLKAGQRFADVIDETQVVDTPLHRTAIMRKDSALMKMATSFMSEPLKTYNMLFDIGRNLYQNPKDAESYKRFVATSFTLFLNAVAVSAAAGLVDAMRDDDEDEEFWDKWMKAFKGDYSEAVTKKDFAMAALTSNLGDNMNPAAMIPFVKDAWSIIQGYDVERSDVTWMADMVNWAKNMIKYMEGDSKFTMQGMMKNTAESFSKMLGVPAKSLLRDLEALENTYINHIAKVDDAERIEEQIGKKAKNYRMGSEENLNYYIEKIVKLHFVGDDSLGEKYANKLVEHGIDSEKVQDRIDSALKSRCKAEPAAMEAAEAWLAKDYTTMKAKLNELKDMGYSGEVAQSAMTSLYNKMTGEDDEPSTEEIKEPFEGDDVDYKDIYRADLKEAYENGGDTARIESQLRSLGLKDKDINDIYRDKISSMFDKANAKGNKAEAERLIGEYVKYNGRESTLRNRIK